MDAQTHDERNLPRLREQLRLSVAIALSIGATREDIAADLLCASRSVRNPGGRETGDAPELAELWTDLDRAALDPPF